MHLCIIHTPSFHCSRNAKIYTPMYNTHLEFHSQSDDQTRLLQSGWLLFWTAVQDNGTVVCLSYPTLAPRTASVSLHVVKFDTVGGPVMACMHGTGRSSRRRSTQLSARSCPKTHHNRAAGREFDGISEDNNTTCVFVDVKNAAAWASCCISRAGTSAG